MAFAVRAKSYKEGKKSSLLVKNGGVLLFLAACGLIYFNAVRKKNELISVLNERRSELVGEIAQLKQERDDLTLQVNSQSDPAWIQLTMMKGLGVVPEGQLKVYFHTADE